MKFALGLAATLALAGAPLSQKRPVEPPPVEKPANPSKLYTTYFYTAGEAVVHGYAPETKVRIVSLEKPGTIFEGTIGVGETKTVQTGRGVFGFLSDKKASILVGTPSSCAVVGYFLKDEEGSFRSNRFFAQLPSAVAGSGDERLIVWAYEAATVEIRIRKTEKLIKQAELKAGGYLELNAATLAGLGSQVLEIKSTGAKVAAQVYYDEGFIVPASNGRGSGKDFFVYAGAITNGVNDVNVISQMLDAKVKLTDIDSGKVIFEGVVKKGGIHSETLSKKHVRVQSDVPVEVVVAGFKHYQGGYAEHHFGTGLEGGGIENDFLVTTSGELWLFSYFAENPVTVTNAQTGEQIFTGSLKAGAVRGLTPGFGLFSVKAQKGLSVMGGASSCGADYSPAAGMFAVDDAMYEVIAQVAVERIEAARKNGIVLTPAAAAAAPLSQQEWSKHGQKVKDRGYQGMSLDEANERQAEIQKQ
ncbi:MAG: Por secretion system C-terminal sorting protein [Myxococcaceae bacterium]|nr:Por secretion system C-terminal sorting protein [Myxococcaceae bacterium]